MQNCTIKKIIKNLTDHKTTLITNKNVLHSIVHGIRPNMTQDRHW